MPTQALGAFVARVEGELCKINYKLALAGIGREYGSSDQLPGALRPACQLPRTERDACIAVGMNLLRCSAMWPNIPHWVQAGKQSSSLSGDLGRSREKFSNDGSNHAFDRTRTRGIRMAIFVF